MQQKSAYPAPHRHETVNEQLIPLCAECVSRLLFKDGKSELVEQQVCRHRGVNLGARPRPPVHLLPSPSKRRE